MMHFIAPSFIKRDIGIVVLLTEHVVCRKGDVLTPEQAKLLVSHFPIVF